MGKVLKKYLELPNVYNSLIQYTSKKEYEITEKIDCFLKGNLWPHMKSRFENKTVFPLTIYFDDLEVNNPLGSHSSIDEIGVIYYKITSLPPEYSSMLENIFLASINRTIDRTDTLVNTSLQEVLQPLINELLDLEKKGIDININGCLVRVYFTVVLICGDNLGLHTLFGLHESFNSNHYCRFCRETKKVMQKQVNENVNSLRSEENYNQDLMDNSHGIKQPCIFNQLASFKVTQNVYGDIMHDLFEGIWRYEVPMLIDHLIRSNSSVLNLKYINERI